MREILLKNNNKSNNNNDDKLSWAIWGHISSLALERKIKKEAEWPGVSEGELHILKF